MKSERRHELKTNTLALALTNLNAWLRKHGGKVLLAIVVIGLVLVLWNKRRLDQIADRATARQALVTVRRAIDNWASTPATPTEIDIKRSAIDEIDKSLTNDIYNKTDERVVRAQASLLEGDLNWQVASWPESSLAATRPALLIEKDHDARLKAARDAYQRVVDEFPEFSGLVAQAHLNLAAVAENQRDWAEATKQYKAVIEDKAAPAAFIELARRSVEALPNLQKAIYIAPATAATSEPATNRSSTRSASSASGPTTR